MKWFRGLVLSLYGVSLMGSPIVLTFEGAGDNVFISNFYNGGTDGAGNSGPNLGVAFVLGGPFGSRSFIDADFGGFFGNFANAPSGRTAMGFKAGVMNVDAGFTTGFSFFYSSQVGNMTLNVYDGLNGTGNILGSVSTTALGECGGDPTGEAYSCWAPAGVAFAGTARSVALDSGSTSQFHFIDNITLGSSRPIDGDPVPEPGTYAMLAGGLAMVAAAKRLRKQVR